MVKLSNQPNYKNPNPNPVPGPILTLEFLSYFLEVGVLGTPMAIQLSQADIQLEVLAQGL